MKIYISLGYGNQPLYDENPYDDEDLSPIDNGPDMNKDSPPINNNDEESLKQTEGRESFPFRNEENSRTPRIKHLNGENVKG